MKVYVPIEDFENMSPPWILLGPRPEILERLNDRLHERETLVFAQLAALVSINEFIQARRISHFPFPVLHAGVIWKIEPSRQSVYSGTRRVPPKVFRDGHAGFSPVLRSWDCGRRKIRSQECCPSFENLFFIGNYSSHRFDIILPIEINGPNPK
jgi:hypothetical protein